MIAMNRQAKQADSSAPDGGAAAAAAGAEGGATVSEGAAALPELQMARCTMQGRSSDNAYKDNKCVRRSGI